MLKLTFCKALTTLEENEQNYGITIYMSMHVILAQNLGRSGWSLSKRRGRLETIKNQICSLN